MMNEAKTAPTMTCEDCYVECQRFGKHRNGLRRFRCPKCKRTFTEPHTADVWTPCISSRIGLCSPSNCCLRETPFGAQSESCEMDRNTIMRLLVLAGKRCEALMDSRMRNLHPRYLEVDEIWTYVRKKARRVRKDDSPEVGDAWVFVAN